MIRVDNEKERERVKMGRNKVKNASPKKDEKIITKIKHKMCNTVRSKMQFNSFVSYHNEWKY
jgi:hypothetical protein